MKEVLLHIGYPKTATTTLQEEIFVKLHEQGKINYLGRTIKSTHTRDGKSLFSGIDWVWHFRQHYIAGKALKKCSISLSLNKLNVISDEDLTFHDFFHNAQFDKEVDLNFLPAKIKNILGNDVNVQVLMTLRNQTDLIFSSFLQKVGLVKANIGDCSFSDYLENKYLYKNKSQIEHLENYNFIKMASRWESVFSKKINILLFEDLKEDKEFFFAGLSSLLKIPLDELLELADQKHYRKRDKSNANIISHYFELTKLGRIFAWFASKDSLKLFLARRYYMRFSFFLKYEKKLFLKRKKFYVSKPTESDCKIIIDMFHESNLVFARKNKLDINKLKKYNYLKNN